MKYLSPKIQNELINLLALHIKDEMVVQLQNSLLFSLILDTTKDIAKIDQMSEVYRYVKIVNDEEGKTIEIKTCETFAYFREIKNKSAQGLVEEIVTSLKETNLDLTKCKGQGYDTLQS